MIFLSCFSVVPARMWRGGRNQSTKHNNGDASRRSHDDFSFPRPMGNRKSKQRAPSASASASAAASADEQMALRRAAEARIAAREAAEAHLAPLLLAAARSLLARRTLHEAQKQAAQRRAVAAELLATERAFVTHLGTLVDVYREPLRPLLAPAALRAAFPPALDPIAAYAAELARSLAEHIDVSASHTASGIRKTCKACGFVPRANKPKRTRTL